ncbi:MAG: hypothetical protein JWM21_4494 [Acidobacteria bacterium]|nr:hypothetical protein [Acidobacteriota bacterium]
MSKEEEITGDESEKFHVEGYPDVSLGNSTLYTVDFKVNYIACGNNTQSVASMKTGAGIWRGACLISSITATVHTPGGNTNATSYTSSGTSYSQFCCIFYQNHYVVTRVET